jgi:protein O-mannosyl-transferase
VTTTPGNKDSPASPRDVDRQAFAACALIAVATAAAYSRTFSVPMLYDDDPSIGFNDTLRHVATAFWPPANSTVGGRPVLNISLALNYAFGGMSVGGYHAVNLVIHMLAAMTVFGIVRHALASRRDPSAVLIALSAALIWALHPLQTESVTYIIQRAESLMALFYLLTLYFFIRGAEGGVRGTAWFCLSFVACLLGMGTKEVMVSAPLIVLLYDRTFIAGSFAVAWSRRRRVYVALGSTWILLGFLVLSTHGRGGTAGPGSGVSWWGYAVTQFPAIVHYLRLCFVPYPLVFDYGTHVELRPLPVLASALLLAILIALTERALVRRPAIGFLGFSFFAILSPSSSIVPVATETMAEHRMYLPLAAVVALVVVGIFRWAGRAAFPVCVAIAALLAGLTWQRNETYRSEEGIWRDTASRVPGNERAHNNLGFKLSTMPGRMDDAIAEYEEALRIKPDYALAHTNLGTALDGIPGRGAEAITHYREAVRLWPDHGEAHYNLGNALMKTPGGLSEAITEYKEAVGLRPDHGEAHYNLGNALILTPGRSSEAIAEYEEAVRLMPAFAAAHNNLGTALEKIPGRRDDAISQYREAMRLEPASAEPHFNLGCALVKTPGHVDEAVAQLRETLRIKPGYAEAHFYLGYALEMIPGHSSDSIAEYEEALRLDPNLAQAHFNLAYALETMPGRLEEAVMHYKEAVRLMPGNAQAHTNLGNALKTMGRMREAAAQYEEALLIKPDDARIHLGLAIVLLQIPGRESETVLHLRESLRLQPDDELARRILDHIAPGQN